MKIQDLFENEEENWKLYVMIFMILYNIFKLCK